MEYRDACEAAGLDPDEVRRITRGLERYGERADALGLTIFGGSGSGSLRTSDGLVVADLVEGSFDGGDGGTRCDANGLIWGESSAFYTRGPHQ